MHSSFLRHPENLDVKNRVIRLSCPTLSLVQSIPIRTATDEYHFSTRSSATQKVPKVNFLTAHKNKNLHLRMFYESNLVLIEEFQQS